MYSCSYSIPFRVRVVNPDSCYPTYDSFLRDNFPQLLDYFKFGFRISKGDCGDLIGFARHKYFHDQIVCVVKTLDRVFLIEMGGLKLVEG